MAAKGSILLHALELTAVNLLLRGVGMVFQAYLSGRVGAAGLGLVQLVATVGGFAMTLGLSGVRVAVLYLCAEEYGRRSYAGMRQALNACLCYGLTVSLAAGTALFFLADVFARAWLHEPLAAGAIRVTALTLPVNCICAVLSGFYTASDQVGKLVRVEVLERVTSLALTFALLIFRAGNDPAKAAESILWGSGLAAALSTVLLYRSYRRDSRFQTDAKLPPIRRRLLRLCAPVALNDYLRAGLGTLEQFLIPWGLTRAGGSYSASMAAYGTVHGMVFPILMFPAALLYSLADLLIPALARCRARGDRLRIYDLTDRCLRMCLLFAGFVSGGMYVLSDALGELIYHSAEAGRFLRIFAPMVLILYLDALVDGMHKGLGQQAANVRYNTLTSFLDVVLLFVLLPRCGIGGYVFSFTVTHILNFFLSFRRLVRVTEYEMPLSCVLRSLVCVLCASAAALCVPPGSPWAVIAQRGGVFLLIFALLLHLCEVLTPADRRWFSGAFSVRR